MKMIMVVCTSCNALKRMHIREDQKLFPFKCEECGLINVNTRVDDSKHCETCTCKTPKPGEFWRLKNGNWIMVRGVELCLEYDKDNEYMGSGFTHEFKGEVTEQLFLNNFEM